MTNLLTGDASTIPGFPTLDIDIGKLHDALAVCEHDGVTYRLGAKAPQRQGFPTFDYPPAFRQIDCSGFARWAMYHATAGQALMPDGSMCQDDWAQAQGFKHHPIAQGQDYTAGLEPDVLYLCFCRTGSRGEGIGHIWAVYGGFTFESHGGVGPSARSPHTSVLVRICTDVYALKRNVQIA